MTLDASHPDDRLLGRLPPDIGLCWDIATAERPGVDEALGPRARGRLVGVRVAHDQDGRRAVPGPGRMTARSNRCRMRDASPNPPSV